MAHEGIEVIAPRELILPSRTASLDGGKKGAIYISGAKLVFHDGTTLVTVTST